MSGAVTPFPMYLHAVHKYIFMFLPLLSFQSQRKLGIVMHLCNIVAFYCTFGNQTSVGDT
jgi:hypothetical protein